MAGGDGRAPASSSPEPQNIALIGFMGSGKSAVGPLVARALDMESVELDEVISAAAGRDIPAIFADEGEEGFRRRESEALAMVLQGGNKVVSCGGGVVLKEENVRMLQERCRVFLLDISLQTAARRLRGSGGRPLLEGSDLEEVAGRLMKERGSAYVEAAHEIVAADDVGPEVLAEEIIARWQRSGCASDRGDTRST